jgi:molybdate transport system substrate-binding protein
MDVYLLSGGAAAGLVNPLKAEFEAKHNCTLHGTFSAVGAMKEALLQGTPCDVVILSKAIEHSINACNWLFLMHFWTLKVRSRPSKALTTPP